jgi:Asp-tRNA(Asn)/Glu-tRNA(Gln) amidotransferase A subunit family amidase
MTKTPWNTDLTSSGSSAGSAAATAAGLVGFAIGTETLGSIISPSLRCGAVGFRPTFGRVSRHGAMALCWTLDKIGPITRSVEDAALVLNAIYGPDGFDNSVIDRPFHWEAASPLSALRVGILSKAFDSFKDKEKEVYDAALSTLARIGVKPTTVEWDEESSNDLRVALTAEAAAAFDDITRDGRVGQLKDQERWAWPNQFRSARLIPAVEYIRAQRARTLTIEKLTKWFEPWDVIVAPPYGMMTTTNFTGHPQIAVPCGFVEGMPRGLSFHSKLFDEGAALRLALAFEQATDFHTRRPPGFTAS